MNVTVVGAGYVGLVTAACLAGAGHDVVCLHEDGAAVAPLNAGRVPFHEAGLARLIADNTAAGRLVFSSDAAASVRHAQVQILAVGTPEAAGTGGADITQVLKACQAVGRYMQQETLVVIKSTVPVGTSALVAQRYGAPGFSVAVNPEFLREGSAVQDFIHPDRIVLGVDPAGPAAARVRRLLEQLYEPLFEGRALLVWMDCRSAELTKYAANAMLAARISFMNEIALLADASGADVEQVRLGIGSDPRIGPAFLQAGAGYGGSCLPKDVRALLAQGAAHGQSMPLLSAVQAVNASRVPALLGKVAARHGGDLEGKAFAVWGLAFKPGTDDMRNAPSRAVIAGLLAMGAHVRAHDPVAVDEARRVLAAEIPQPLMARVTFHDTALDSAREADGVVIVTEWDEYRRVDLGLLKAGLRDAAVFDGRNIRDPAGMAAQGIAYFAMGRGS